MVWAYSLGGWRGQGSQRWDRAAHATSVWDCHISQLFVVLPGQAGHIQPCFSSSLFASINNITGAAQTQAVPWQGRDNIKDQDCDQSPKIPRAPKAHPPSSVSPQGCKMPLVRTTTHTSHRRKPAQAKAGHEATRCKFLLLSSRLVSAQLKLIWGTSSVH